MVSRMRENYKHSDINGEIHSKVIPHEMGILQMPTNNWVHKNRQTSKQKKNKKKQTNKQTSNIKAIALLTTHYIQLSKERNVVFSNYSHVRAHMRVASTCPIQFG